MRVRAAMDMPSSPDVHFPFECDLKAAHGRAGKADRKPDVRRVEVTRHRSTAVVDSMSVRLGKVALESALSMLSLRVGVLS